jgi:hypothetical protein
MDSSTKPLRIETPDEALQDLRDRLRTTRWPDAETVEDIVPLSSNRGSLSMNSAPCFVSSGSTVRAKSVGWSKLNKANCRTRRYAEAMGGRRAL